MKRLQYSTRTLFALVTLASIACVIGVGVVRIRNRESQALVALERYGVVALASNSPSIWSSKIVVYAECHENIPREVIHIISTLPHLKSLGFCESRFTDGDLQQLTHCHCLRSLDVSRTSVTDASIPTLLGFESLTALQIAGSQITASGATQLLARGHLSHLSLDGKQASLIQWSGTGKATGLRTLSLVGESVTCEVATRAARDSGAQSLLLYGCGFSRADFEVVVRNAAFGTSVTEEIP